MVISQRTEELRSRETHLEAEGWMGWTGAALGGPWNRRTTAAVVLHNPNPKTGNKVGEVGEIDGEIGGETDGK